MNDADAQLIRDVVREEFERARDKGVLLSDDERHFVREWIDTTNKRRDFFNDVLKKTIVWAVLGIVAAMAMALWEYFKAKVTSA